MASRKEQKEKLRAERLQREREQDRQRRMRGLQMRVAVVVGAAVIVLGGVFVAVGGAGGGDGGSGEPEQAAAQGGGKAGAFAFAVGDPGPGEPAPDFSLPSTDGGTFDLSEQRGKRVLLYFQEGIMCQPCWDQITDLEKDQAALDELGIDQMVSITTDPLDHLTQKRADGGFETHVLSDPDLSVSRAYETNKYGMMGENYNGHSLIVVSPDGRIEHRADYGGAPDYTMYLPPANLIADLRKGMRDSS